MSKVPSFLAGAVAGAAAAYFLDPDSGTRRRDETVRRTRSRVKATTSSAAAQASAQAGKAAGRAHSVARSATPGGAPPDDVTLARTVETAIFRPADAPKGQVSVNAENGVVFLRGEVAPEWIERLGAEAERVEGVKGVRNLLHAPGTPAPTAPAAT